MTLLLLNANAVKIPLADESVHCVVTSPPYWGLRDYGIGDQLGLEPTPEQYIENMVAVFREVKRVLRSDGTAWINMGDAYAHSSSGGGGAVDVRKDGRKTTDGDKVRGRMAGANTISGNLKPKDLCGIPWALAKALQAPYYTGRIRDEKDRVWLAAMIDGEGTICGFTHVRKDNGQTRRGISIHVTNSNIAILDECYRIWKTSRRQHNPHGKGHFGDLDMYRWIPHGVDDKSLLMNELYSYMVGKKKQALLAWNFLEISKQARGRNKGKIGDANREKSAWIVDALSKLNHLEDVDIPNWIKEPPSLYEPGWYLRSDIIWSKKNPMPESVTDRPTKAHEYVFLMTKSARYYYDADAVREPQSEGTLERFGNGRADRKMSPKYSGNEFGVAKEYKRKAILLSGRNRRTVWHIATAPYSGAHFATYPPALVEPCIKAGTSERGVCPECGAPWERVVEKELKQYHERGSYDWHPDHGDLNPYKNQFQHSPVGWRKESTTLGRA